MARRLASNAGEQMRWDLEDFYAQLGVETDRPNNFTSLLKNKEDFPRIHGQAAEEGRRLDHDGEQYIGVVVEEEPVDADADWRAEWRRLVGG